jgi:hypothetical protein
MGHFSENYEGAQYTSTIDAPVLPEQLDLPLQKTSKPEQVKLHRGYCRTHAFQFSVEHGHSQFSLLQRQQ